jgi:hypothetical protein
VARSRSIHSWCSASAAVGDVGVDPEPGAEPLAGVGVGLGAEQGCHLLLFDDRAGDAERLPLRSQPPSLALTCGLTGSHIVALGTASDLFGQVLVAASDGDGADAQHDATDLSQRQ